MMNRVRTVLLLATSLALLACGSEESSNTASSSADGARRVAITVNAGGYDPAEVTATAGRPITLVFTRVTDEGCGEVLAIPAHDIRRDLPLNQPVEVTFTPQAGRIRFTCGMDMYDGTLVVQ
jgi:plastocyanin domain-containing protein